eukprot:Hpha_TRINITY_DN15936_c2_g6::TRINITY_DN15936_c2_g6_i1::g.75144::m.75144/K13218/PTBP1, PTB; polypyrimidine tract-binding protein 1
MDGEEGGGGGKVIYFPLLPPPVQPTNVLQTLASVAEVQKHYFHTDPRRLFVEVASVEQAQKAVDLFQLNEVQGHLLRAHISSRRSVNAPLTPVLMFTVTDPGRGLSCDALRDVFDSNCSKDGRGVTVRMQLLGAAAQNGGSEQAAAAQIRGWVEFTGVDVAETVLESLQGATFPEIGTLTMTTSRQEGVTVKAPQHGKDFTTGEGEGTCPPFGIGVKPQSSVLGDGPCVVLVSNLPEGVTPEMLFRLFGTVGDVLAVKILFAKRSEALVQFRCSEHAQAASRLLRGTPLYNSGKEGIRVVPARSNVVTGPADDLTAYWPAPCPLHRFAGGFAARALKHRCQPTQRLHVANVPTQTPQGTLPEIIAQVAEATSVRWLQRSAGEDRSRQALISFPSVRCAVATLIGLHTYEPPGLDLPGGRGLVVSFSAQGDRTDETQVHGLCPPPPSAEAAPSEVPS